MDKVFKPNPFLEVLEQYKCSAERKKQKKKKRGDSHTLWFTNPNALENRGGSDGWERPSYLCFLMPLESASPPPQSLPSDILCCLLLGDFPFINTWVHFNPGSCLCPKCKDFSRLCSVNLEHILNIHSLIVDNFLQMI